MNEASPAKYDKYRAYRERKKAKGLREVRMWVLDTRTPEFKEAVKRQAEAIRKSAEDREIARGMELALAEVWNDLP